MKKINLMLSFLLIFCAQFAHADITIPVNNYVDLVNGIEEAIEHAEIGAGQTATIILSSGLPIDLEAPLPDINHTNGTIIIKGASTSDGLKAIAGTWPGDRRYGFRAVDANDLEIKNLRFEGFTSNMTSGDVKSTIGLRDLSSVRVENCSFVDCKEAINITYTTDKLTGDILVSGNSFNDCDEGVDLNLDHALLPSSNFSGDLIQINDNTLTVVRRGISVTVLYDNTLANVEIIGNSVENFSNVSGSIGIYLINPRRGFVVCNSNTITRFEEGIFCGNSGMGFEAGVYGIDFISIPNTLSMPEKNGGNTISNCKYSFNLRSDLPNHFEYNIVAYEVDGTIKVHDDYSSSLRENIIKKSVNWTYSTPILLEQPTANNGIQSPVLINVDYLGTNLDILYSTVEVGLLEENGPFIAEFFEVDADKSVLQYLGNQSIPTALGTSYSIEYSDKVLTPGSNIGITITSLGTNVSTYKIGTSEMAVSSITDIQLPCEDCEKFSPTPGEHYWMSAWVNVEEEDNPVKTYENVSLQLMAFGGETAIKTAFPTGEIIDGWQRIVVDFTMPATSDYFRLRLNAHPTLDTYFDDIRIHPFNGSMKSYVYDGETFWLSSELDDNNYATFYEYDEEGGLVRIKKETSRGIVTIQETRSNTLKKDNHVE